MTVPSAQAFNPTRHLCWGDIAFDRNESPTLMKVYLKQSKCDQLGEGEDIYVGSTNTAICPVTAMLGFIAVGHNRWTAFPVINNQPLTNQVFVARVRLALQEGQTDTAGA